VARLGPILVASVLALSAACSDGDSAVRVDARGDDAITVGSFDFPESVLLAELYSQALEAKGLRVVRAFGLGPREFVGPALAAGLVEMVPEYAGTAVGFASAAKVLGSADPTRTHQALEAALAGTPVEALASAPAEDANAFVVTDATARSHDLARLSDLAAVAGDLRFGGPPECTKRRLCLVGLRERYGVTFGAVSALTAGPVIVHALRSGAVDVALMFTSDPAIEEFVVLDDDRGLQPADPVTPLIRADAVARFGPALPAAIDAVSRMLDSPTLRSLNARDARRPGSDDVPAIAAAWLHEVGLA
jgi:osmoprotectant transport system substrate-binding protein